MNGKIAIVGGGIAGLTAAYLLNEKYDITLFEKDDRIGGNAHTFNTMDGDELDISVFFYSFESYPNFFKLLSKLGIDSDTPRLTGASMTLQNLDNQKMLYFNAAKRGRFRRLLPTNLRMTLNGMRMGKNIVKGLKLYREGALEGLSMKEALELLPDLKGYSLKIIIFPLCLISSMLYDEVMEAPATYFFGKLHNHFGTITKVGAWRLINCRTKKYIEALAKSYHDKIILNSNIKSIARTDKNVTIKMNDGKVLQFDKIVFACNADQALKLLEEPTKNEKQILGAWKYKDGLVAVHKAGSAFPKKKFWSMYAYLYTEKNNEINTSINACYRYQVGVSNNCEYLGTQHPNFSIKEDLIEFQRVFRTPLYDTSSVSTIKELPSLNGKMNSYYCGSHFGYGLHEDAVTSAIAASKSMGAEWD